MLGRLPSPAVDASSVSSAVKLFQSFQEFGQEMHGDLGIAFHLAPEQEGIKTELLGQWNGDKGGFPTAIAPLLALAKSKGLNCRLDSRELSESHVITDAGGSLELTSIGLPAYLESLHNVGGDWSAINRRGPHVNPEHVNFYA